MYLTGCVVSFFLILTDNFLLQVHSHFIILDIFRLLMSLRRTLQCFLSCDLFYLAGVFWTWEPVSTMIFCWNDCTYQSITVLLHAPLQKRTENNRSLVVPRLLIDGNNYSAFTNFVECFFANIFVIACMEPARLGITQWQRSLSNAIWDMRVWCPCNGKLHSS